MSIRSHLSKLTEGILDSPDAVQNDRAPNTSDKKSSPSLTAPGALAHFSKDYREMETEVSKLKAAQGYPAIIAIKDLVTSPFQTRNMDESRIQELLANLTANPLSTPVTVRSIGELSAQRYELVAGHHRVEAFKRLGRSEITASVITLSDAQAQSLVFYDNLLSPQLLDFEKYLGFASLKQSRGLTLEDMAAESGLSKSLVGLIMSFSKLAPEVLSAIKKHPATVSASLAQKLCSLKPDLQSRIITAVEMIAEGKLMQATAVRWIEQIPVPPKAQSTPIKAGRYKYAEISHRPGQVTIKFSDPDESNAAQEELIALLQQRAHQSV